PGGAESVRLVDRTGTVAPPARSEVAALHEETLVTAGAEPARMAGLVGPFAAAGAALLAAALPAAPGLGSAAAELGAPPAPAAPEEFAAPPGLPAEAAPLPGRSAIARVA